MTWIPARHWEIEIFGLDEAKGGTMICLNVFRTFRFEPRSAVSCTRSFNSRLIPSAGESDSAAPHRRLCTAFLRPSSQLGLWIKETSRSCWLLVHLLGPCASNADSLCLIEHCLKHPQKEAKRNKAPLKEFNNTWTLF